MEYNVKQLIENQAKEGTECEKVLGSTPRVRQMASLWTRHAQLFHLIGADALLDWTKEQNFTSEELKAFRTGLSAIPDFMQKCFNEIEEASKQDSND